MKLTQSLSRVRAAPTYAAQWAAASLRVTPLIWDFLNRSGNAVYRAQRPTLDDAQRPLLRSLEETGIAITSLDELFPGKELAKELAAQTHGLDGAEVGARKSFLRYSLGEHSEIDLGNPLIRFSLDPRVLHVVNAYLRTCAKLRYFELAMTRVVDSAAPMGSQRWHRDPGMKRIIKTFLYLSDVDETSGPFTYVAHSHKNGSLGTLYPQKQFGRGGRYPPAGAVERHVSDGDIRVCTGRAGTLILCDTTGLHRGGFSISKPRVMYTSVYVPPADTLTVKFAYPADFPSQLGKLDPVARFAVAP